MTHSHFIIIITHHSHPHSRHYVMLKNLTILTRGSNTDLQPTNTSVEIDCATGVHVTRNGEYINRSDRGLTRVARMQNRNEM